MAAACVVLGACAGGARAAEGAGAAESFFFSKEAPVGSADTVANVPAMSNDDDDSPAPDKNREGGGTFRFLEQVGLPAPKMLPVALDPATAATGCIHLIPKSHELGCLNPSHHSGFLTEAMAEAGFGLARSARRQQITSIERGPSCRAPRSHRAPAAHERKLYRVGPNYGPTLGL